MCKEYIILSWFDNFYRCFICDERSILAHILILIRVDRSFLPQIVVDGIVTPCSNEKQRIPHQDTGHEDGPVEAVILR